ncbi:hypothetical protein QBC38DRAFT_530410 [Podospora fimiseda]|uniref:Uncharacterized protein n=1 Tax=Podospora fimiseda TaxID=252190 RepID=A0AAN7GW89_9PEZI|nr:hypothetical protein QBC38DRAFT_530410 [Podospora fimiseda]
MHRRASPSAVVGHLLRIVLQVSGNIIEDIAVDFFKKSVFDIEVGDDQFFALLASEHGKGPARMLSAYPEMLEGRCLSRARVFLNKDHNRKVTKFLDPTFASLLNRFLHPHHRHQVPLPLK